MSTDAATSCLNLAEPLIDGSMIYVPTVSDIYSETGSVNSDTSSYSGLNPITPSYGQTPSLQGPSDSGLNLLTAASSGSSSTGMVNINTASRSELMTLNGIGEAKADKIIAYREEHGGFDSIEDIMNITGIKEGMFNKIKDQICVR
ncbi:MAG: helix-hairpin-helix domain-containing protein [Lachnospiraceae bacterium]|nr:helix-hairpin-helix domain-containing protein [Lachnospiraceae bacterium]